jgi:acyl carrier protein
MDEALALRIARREHVLDGIRAIVRDRLRVEREMDEIDPATPLFGSGLGLDSVDALELVVSIEDAFGVRIPDGSAARAALRTLDTLAEFVLQHGGVAP